MGIIVVKDLTDSASRNDIKYSWGDPFEMAKFESVAGGLSVCILLIRISQGKGWAGISVSHSINPRV